jgi:hypothetical protein
MEEVVKCIAGAAVLAIVIMLLHGIRMMRVRDQVDKDLREAAGDDDSKDVSKAIDDIADLLRR